MKRLFLSILIFLVMVVPSWAVDYYPSPSCADQSSSSAGCLQGMITAIGSSKNANIVFRHSSSGNTTTYTITAASITSPANVSIKIEPGARVSIASGKTITINGPFSAGNYQVFTGSGTVVGLAENNLVWFGGLPDGATTDFVAPLKAAVAATATNGTLYIPANGTKYYKYDNATNGLDDAATVDKALTIILDGTIKQTGYVYNTPAAKPPFIFNVTGNNVTIKGSGALQGPGSFAVTNGTYSNCAGLIRNYQTSGFHLQGVTLKDPPQVGLMSIDSDEVTVDGATKFTGGPLVADATDTGHFYIYLNGGDDITITGNHFFADSSGGSTRQAIFSGTTFGVPTGLIVTGNTFRNIHEHAIYCYTNNSAFTNNAIYYGQAAADQKGSAIKVLGSRNDVSHNLIYNPAKGGINLFGGSYNTASHNRIYDFGQVGIYVGDQDANANGLNYNIVDANTLIGRTDGATLYQGILYMGHGTHTTADCIGGKIINNVILNAGSASAITLSPVAVYHDNAANSYRMLHFDVSGNEAANYNSVGGAYFENVHFAKVRDNAFRDGATTMRGLYWSGANTFNRIEKNTVRDDKASPTLDAGNYFASTSCTDNAIVGNEAYGAVSLTNLWGISATYRNTTDKNINDLTRGYPLALNTAEATANIEGDASTTITLSIPTGSRLLGVQLRVDAALAAGETWDAAFSGGSSTTIATAQAVAKNTKVNLQVVDEIAANTTNIAITKNGGGSFTAQGTITALVYYETLTTLGDAP